jgi:hypothetical protein
MPGQRRPKRNKSEGRKARAIRRKALKEAEEVPDEELGPGRRTELTQEIEAERFRGKPPSI